ncbi:NIL domain-containing protein [Candidatus Saganbacteria bacterium]|nr:NIL domain-containing protein [Candidatus Saganbacteria bacterium]
MAKLPTRLIKVTFPQALIKKPVIFTMAKKFNVMPNIRRARVTADIGEMALELVGGEKDLEKALQYLSKAGLIVEPIVGDIIE